MIFNFKKVASVLASAVMLSSTIGFAAASYPEPFVTSGAADGAVVYGAAAAISDLTAAIDVQSNLQALVTTANTGTSTTVGGTAWKVGTSSDKLELGESIRDIVTYIDDTDLSLLADGTIDNEKGTAKYEQFFYFEDVTSSSVNYTENEDSVAGLFFKINSGEVIARYVIDFTSHFKSDIVATNKYEDIEDEIINILEKDYVITSAINSSSTLTDLTLMSGAAKGTVTNDEEIVIGGRTVSVVVSATNAAQFTVDGETTNKLAEGDTEPLSDGTYIGVTDITYQDFSGGLMQATIYLGADKLFLDDGSSLQVNAETINQAAVTITEDLTTTAGDVSISQIAINLTAEDDLYVPIDGKLSEAGNLDEPEVLITQNWDIEFKGTEAQESETLTLVPTGSDKDYKLTFDNYDGDTIGFQLLFTNDTGIFGGEKEGRRLNLVPNMSTVGGTAIGENVKPIVKNNYFILNTADPTDDTTDARSYVVQYKGADKTTDTDPKVTFDILGIETGREVTLAASGTSTLKLGGTSFNFKNTSSCDSSTNCNLMLNQADYATGGWNASVSNYIRTHNNAWINITDTNHTSDDDNSGVSVSGNSANWEVTLYIDDANRDGDEKDVSSTAETVFVLTFNNATSADAGASISLSSDAVTDNSNSDLTKWQSQHGVYIESEDPSASPLTLTATIPDGAIEPLVYITSGVVTVTPGSTGGGGQILIVKDSEVSSVASKNLFVVGGSCINTVAAKILGSDSPLCEAAFTEVSGAGVGQYLIKVVAASEAVTGGDEAKIAMLVAGYEATDTQNAVVKAIEGVSADIGEQVYPITATTTE